jgi:hypothetical protein
VATAPPAPPLAESPAPAPAPPPAAAPSASHELPPSTGDDWPEPDAPNTPGQDANKRKRRRRKGKGQGLQPNAQPHPNSPSEEIFTLGEATPAATADAPPPPHRPPVAPLRQPAARPKLDPESLATKAWKIYLAEVSEEGVALVNDQDARELARRCFRLAELFIEEQSRRLQA